MASLRLVGNQLEVDNFNGFSMTFQWIFKGFSMDFQIFKWIFDGFSMVFQWILNGVVIVFWRFLAAPGSVILIGGGMAPR